MNRDLFILFDRTLPGNEQSFTATAIGNEAALHIRLFYQARLLTRVGFDSLENKGVFAPVLNSLELLPQ
jgi:hypothetical protein